jgi:(1->4)-alpha-D-glucan 1-alpha-D-glucosylmutase
MREAKADTFWTAPDEGYEARVTEAAARAAAAFAAPEGLDAPAARAEGLALAQCALKLFAPGIPDIYQGTEVGSWLLTDPDNRRPVDFDAMPAGGATSFDRLKNGLTRTILRLRRERPADLAAPWEALDAPEGQLAARRGALRLEVSLTGLPLPGTDPAIWPPEAAGPQPVRLSMMG